MNTTNDLTINIFKVLLVPKYYQTASVRSTEIQEAAEDRPKLPVSMFIR